MDQKIYSGIVSYTDTASVPVEVVILHNYKPVTDTQIW